ncbi:MAG: ribosome silencing factor [Simkaniaceae bacterium]|nr:ribosome silencing factor [Simkaniaceae bacterium]
MNTSRRIVFIADGNHNSCLDDLEDIVYPSFLIWNTKKNSDMSILDLVKKAAQAIYDKKGINILVIDTRGVSSMADFVIVAEGSVERHVQALAREVISSLKEEGVSPAFEEGLMRGDWIALDYIDFIVHILTPDLRNYYQIERIWSDAKVVSINYKTTV